MAQNGLTDIFVRRFAGPPPWGAGFDSVICNTSACGESDMQKQHNARARRRTLIDMNMYITVKPSAICALAETEIKTAIGHMSFALLLSGTCQHTSTLATPPRESVCARLAI
jgi:hypothetical protein